MQRASTEVLKALAVTAEVCGSEISEGAAMVMADDLAQYPEAAVLDALKRVRREHKGRLVLAAVIERIDDGRPGVEVAWAMVPRDERDTAVLTSEMLAALRIAQPLLEAGDEVAARMAFKEAYTASVERARADSLPVEWSASLGWDHTGRPGPLADAVRRGRLPLDRALSYVHGDAAHEIKALVGLQVEALQPPATIQALVDKMPVAIPKPAPKESAPRKKWGGAYLRDNGEAA